MILYKNCKLYRAGDAAKTTVTVLDVEAELPLYDNIGFSGGDALSVDSSKVVTTSHQFEYASDNFNIVFPDGIELKITGVSTIPANRGGWKPKKRYKLTLMG